MKTQGEGGRGVSAEKQQLKRDKDCMQKIKKSADCSDILLTQNFD